MELPPNPARRQTISIFWKIYFWVALVIIVTTLTLGIVIVRQMEKDLMAQFTHRGYTLARTLAWTSASSILDSDKLSLERLIGRIQKESDVLQCFLVDRGNKIIVHSDISRTGTWYKPPAGVISPEEQGLYTIEFEESRGQSALLVATPIEFAKKQIGAAFVVFSKNALERSVGAAQFTIFLVIFLSLAFAVISSYAIISLITKPIRRLAAGVKRIGQGDLHHQIHISSRDELGALAQSFNQMTEKLAKAQDELVEKESMMRELRIAHEIQQKLLPQKTPSNDAFIFGAFYQSTKEVGGDYFDFIPIDEHRLGVVNADVSGKGVPGSLIMTMARSIIRSTAVIEFSPVEVLKRTNRIIIPDMRRGMFVTICYALLDTQTGILTVANAGHTDLILYQPDKKLLTRHNPKGMAIGLDSGGKFDRLIEQETITLTPGALALLFTDGVTEAMNNVNAEFGDERLETVFREFGDLEPSQFIGHLMAAIDDFTQGAPRSDDITVVAIKRRQSS